ncbi:MAG: nucleotidyltransferase family protein [Chloroflexi bacterium]|nr:nucleotidyltransferase family protein [Chloroflexota bacterium]
MEQQTISDLLLTGISYDSGRVDASKLERLSAADGEALLDLAAKQRVSPLLYHRLVARGLETRVPAEIMQGLRRAYLVNAARNMRLHHELGEIVSGLRRGGIAVIVLKGAFLADAVYDNVALRGIGDIDLLVPQEDVTKSREVLTALGYHSLRSFSVDIHVDFATAKHLSPFVKPNMPWVEIHWNITSPGRQHSIDVAELWERAVPATVAGVEVLALCAEDLLLYLCLHASYQHCFQLGLSALCDIAATIRHYGDDMDWAQVRQRAEQWRWRRGVHLALYLARELVGAAVPDDVLRDLQPVGFSETIAAVVKEQLFSDQKMTSANFAQLWGAKRPQDKAVHLFRILFPSPLNMSTLYPAPPDSARIYLYYPVRLVDVLRRYGRATWCLLRGDQQTTLLAERKNVLSDWLAEEWVREA